MNAGSETASNPDHRGPDRRRPNVVAQSARRRTPRCKTLLTRLVALVAVMTALLASSVNEQVRAETASWECRRELRGCQSVVGSFLWYLDRIDERSRPLDGRYYYDSTGSGVNVYVVDDGVDTSLATFGGRATMDWSVAGPVVACGHGTKVAQIIGSEDAGVAKRVRIHSVRVVRVDENCDERLDFDDLIAGLKWIRANAKTPAVVNISLGLKRPHLSHFDGDFVRLAKSWQWIRVGQEVQNLLNDGILVVAAAGQIDGSTPYGIDACESTPGNIDGVLTVGASGRTDEPIWGFNWGKCIDLFAPGFDVLDPYSWGSSFAAPQVTAAAALLLERDPELRPDELHRLIVDSATEDVLDGLDRDTTNRLLYIGGDDLSRLADASHDPGNTWLGAVGTWDTPDRLTSD